MTSRNDQTTYKVLTAQNLSFTGAHAEAAALGNETTIVRIFANQNCYAAFTGIASVGGSNSVKLAAGIPEYFTVDPGAVISMISDGTNGVANITEMSQ